MLNLSLFPGIESINNNTRLVSTNPSLTSTPMNNRRPTTNRNDSKSTFGNRSNDYVGNENKIDKLKTYG